MEQQQQQEQQEAGKQELMEQIGNPELKMIGEDRISSDDEWEEEPIGNLSAYERNYFDQDVVYNELSEDERIACDDFLDMNLTSRDQDFDEMMRSLSGMDRGIVVFAILIRKTRIFSRCPLKTISIFSRKTQIGVY